MHQSDWLPATLVMFAALILLFRLINGRFRKDPDLAADQKSENHNDPT